MKPKIHYFNRPDGERDVVFMAHHGCPAAKQYQILDGFDDIDLIQFSVGLVGEGMPLGVSFDVASSNDCGACGKALKIRCEWVKGDSNYGSGLWTPD